MKPKHVSPEDGLLFLLGELSPDRQNDVERHLESCKACKKAAEQERTLMRLLSRRPSWNPQESLLIRQRNLLMQNLKRTLSLKGKRTLWDTLRNAAPAFRVFRLQWATVAAFFCIGLLAGRFFQLRVGTDSASRHEALALLQSSAPISDLDVAALDDGSDRVAIRFKTINDRVLTGRIADPDIQRALSIVLQHSPGDHIRLKTLSLLEKIKPDRKEVQQALIHALENDGNPGVRLKAIRLLIDAFPVNETVKNVLVGAFFRDT
ncbi:MAG TPA: zf-HC2 domain-containing protein, partial [bacterium]